MFDSLAHFSFSGEPAVETDGRFANQVEKVETKVETNQVETTLRNPPPRQGLCGELFAEVR